MNVTKLKTALLEGKFDAAGYRILEAPDNNTWCLKRQGNTWLVFYFERGQRWELHRFKNEAIACEYFYNRIVHG